MDPGSLVEITIWGLLAGCIYILLAIGLNLIFGVMKVVNFAHGELLMLSMYMTFLMHTTLGLNPYLVMPLSVALMAFIGVLIERVGFRPIMGTGKLNEIFLSLGLIYLLQNTVALIWGTDPKMIHSPFESDLISFGSVKIPLDYIIIIGTTLMLLVILQIFLKKTTPGRAMRATSQNREAAMLMGINVERMDMISFGLGSALAATAGTLWCISGVNFDPYVGSEPAIKAFAVIIIGGLGSMQGAVFGGLLLGLAENPLLVLADMGWTEIAGFLTFLNLPQDISFLSWKNTVSFLILIIVLIFKPEGLFGEKGE
ncbi:MAG: branched-chain amino acid ABC transporter permease [Candidatus Altiarchaeales archaeon]|nr:branched-chain amino acid ABC transporter permease [Candidatus Altiarchaeales archaeon]